MEKHVGLWIDHRKAVIVTVEGESEGVQEIQSNMEKRVRFSSNSEPKNLNQPKGSLAEDMRDRQYYDDLNNFYDKVIAAIRTAETIWIFGPGEAKGELEKRLQLAGLGEHIVAVETVDKLTDRQIVAKIRDGYLK